MAERENSMNEQADNKAVSRCSSPDSVTDFQQQLADVEQVLHQSEQKSLYLIDILKQSRSDFFAIFDSVPAVIWYRDRKGTILRANQAAAESVGMDVRRLVGKNYYELVPEQADRCKRYDHTVIDSGRPMRGILREYQIRRATRWLTEDRFPLRDREDHVVGLMVFAQDVTEKKQADEKLLQAKKEIEIRNEQLKLAAARSARLAEQASQSNLAKSEILASSSHDLRTPMNAIIGFAELLLETQLDGEQQEYVEIIHKSSTGLLSLINDILDFTKLEVGKLNIQIVPCELAAFIQDVRSLMEPSVLQKGLLFNIRLDPHLPKSFFTDPMRLRQCLVNLIGNAVKFTGSGSISLTVSPERRKARPCIRFDVEDTGIGISKEKQQQIFESYAQAEAATERTYGGTGLGLTITRKLVDLLGGHITVRSEPGKGSVFSIVLPLVDSEAPDVTAPAGETPEAQGDESRLPCQGRILVGETDLPGQLTMNLLLRRVGLSVDIAVSRQQFYEKAQAAEYDLFILDMRDAGEQDLMLMRRLQGLTNKTSMIAIGPCNLDLLKRTLAAGCGKYLTKPVSRRQLYDAIFELMQQTAFEKQLRTIAPGSRPTAPAVPDPADGETSRYRDLVRLLQSLIRQFPETVGTGDSDQITAVMNAVDRAAAASSNPEYLRRLNILKELFQADLNNQQQRLELLRQLEQICRDIHDYFEHRSD